MGLAAQSLTDLNSPLYRDLDRWEVQGVIRQLPLLKPYGGVLLQGLLQQVLANGSADDQAKAKRYVDAYLHPVGVRLEVGATEYFGPQDWFGLHSGVIHVQGSVGDAVHIESNVDTLVLQTTAMGSGFVAPALAQTNLPAGLDYPFDWFLDQTFNQVGNTLLAVTPAYGSLVSFGAPSAAFQLGDVRAAFGEALGDGIVLSPQSIQAPQISFTWTTDTTIISLLTMSLTATNWTGNGGATPGKYLSLSTAQWRPLDWMEINVWQTSVYGQRFALEYLMPSIYFLSAEQNGNYDNLFLGGGGTLHVIPDVDLRAQLYLDDFQIMKFLFGDSHTGLKAALQAELDWQPRFLPGFSLVGVYSAVAPYTYAHWPDYLDANRGAEFNSANYALNDLPNYLDYSHSGKNLGLSLGPNSDRSALQTRYELPTGLSFGAGVVMTRHANASEGADATKYPYLTRTQQGTVFDHGLDLLGVGEHLFANAPFLGQTTESRLRGTLDGELPLPDWNLSLAASASVEYAWNRGLKLGDDGWGLYGSFAVKYLLF